MPLQWVLSLFFAGVIATTGLAACVCLFLSLKRETHEDVRRVQLVQEELASTLERVADRLDGVAAEIRGIEERAARVTAPPLSISGFNLNKRTQALRMSRRGETPAQIAAALCLPGREVELLLKVQKLSASAVQTRSAGV
jgi:hypothetical protein